MNTWTIKILKVKSFCGFCDITWKSSLQPQILSELFPPNYGKPQIHNTLAEAVDKFYTVNGIPFGLNGNQNYKGGNENGTSGEQWL